MFVRPKIITVGIGIAYTLTVELPELLPMPRPKPPKPTKTKERKKNCTKQNSPVWTGFQNARRGWKTDGTYYYKWDESHKDIEKYDKHGKHQGSVDPATGKLYRGPQTSHNLPKSQRDW